jgi:DNA-binding transcriptional LysR family regulator
LLAEGFDLGLRSHEHDLQDSTLVARRLAVLSMILVARPGLLEDDALSPKAIESLEGLCLHAHEGVASWTLRNRNDDATILRLKSRLVSDDPAMLKEAAMAGHGVAVLPLFTCQRELESGELVRVLPDWCASPRSLSLILPSSRGVMPAVRALCDFLIERIPLSVQQPSLQDHGANPH